ncbi:MAG TPA: hypothetical protein VHZ78_09685 [Rhizomicrobium sp.]|jgi:hypothetical protein|nr:hypothetical protein [Rhizomicrobium sp.]
MTGTDASAAGRETLMAVWRRIVWLALLLGTVFSARAAVVHTIGLSYSLLATIVLAVVFWYCAVVVHELGHAICAWAVGWRVHSIAVSVFSYLPARRRFQRQESKGEADFSGAVFATPRTPDGWRRGSIFYVLDGPLANILLGGAAIAAAGSDGLPAILGGLGLTSLCMGIANLLPTRSAQGGWSDGGVILRVVGGHTIAEHQPIALWLTGSIVDGVPPRSWDASLMPRLEAEAGTDAINKLGVQLNFYLVVGDIKNALRVLEDSSDVREGRWPEFVADHAFLVALAGHDVPRAAAMLNTIVSTSRDTFRYQRARCVIAALSGRHAEACAAVADARRVARATAAVPDADDEALFAAIEQGRELPTDFAKP